MRNGFETPEEEIYYWKLQVIRANSDAGNYATQLAEAQRQILVEQDLRKAAHQHLYAAEERIRQMQRENPGVG